MTIDGQIAQSVDVTVPQAPDALCDGTDPVIAYLFSPGWATPEGGTSGSQDRRGHRRDGRRRQPI
jgi:hypothetical protein